MTFALGKRNGTAAGNTVLVDVLGKDPEAWE